MIFRKSCSFILNTSLILLLIFPYYIISSYNKYFFKSYLFLLIPLLSLYLFKNVKSICALIIYANLFYCFAKFIFLVCFYFSPITVGIFVDHYFNNLIFYSSIGFLDIPRFVTSNDYVTPFCIFFLLLQKKYFLVPILIFSVLLTLSFHLLCVLITLFSLYCLIKISVRNLPFIILISFSLFSLFYISFSGFHGRFGGEFILSINSKLYQTHMFLSHFINNPFFGNGFGFYVSDYVRNNSNPFVYENFIMSYLMQAGIVFSFIYIISILLFCKIKRYFLNILLLLILLSYGFTNPVLITPPVLILIAYLFNYKILID